MFERFKLFLFSRMTERILFSAAIIIFATLVVVIIVFTFETNQSKFASNEIEHTQKKINQIQKLQQLTDECTSSVKNLLVNGHSGDLEKSENIKRNLRNQIDQTNSLIKENAVVHKKNYYSLISFLEKKNIVLDSIIALRKRENKEAALFLFNKEFDFTYTNTVKTMFSEIEQNEQEMLVFNQNEKKEAVQLIYRQLYFFIALIIILIALILIWINIKYEKKTIKAGEYTSILTSNVTDAVIILDLQWRILSWNETAEKIYGWEKQEVIDKVLFRLLKTEYFDFTKDGILDRLNRRETVETEVVQTAKNGNKLNIVVTKSGFFDYDGKLTGIITINKDITAFRKMEEALKESNQLLEETVEQRTKELHKSNSLYQFISLVNQLIIHTHEEKQLFDGICKIAIEAGGFKMAWIGTVNEAGNLIPVAQAGDTTGYLNSMKPISIHDIPEGNGPAGIALRNGTYYVCQDIFKDVTLSLWKEEQLKRGFRSGIALSIKKFGKVVGGFILYADVPDFFDESVTRLMTEATEDIGRCLEFIESEKQKKEHEILLLEKDAITNAFFNTTPDGIILGSPDGITYYANKSVCDLFGYTAEEVLKKRRNELMDDTDPKFPFFIKEVLEKGQARSEFTFIKKDGTRFPAEVSNSIFRSPGGKAYASVIIHDETERASREKLIKDYQYAIDQASLVDVSSKSGLITYVNENFCSITKYTKDELIGKNQRILNSGYHPKKMYTELWRTILGGRVWTGELRNKAKDGSIFWVHTTIVPFLDSSGEITQFLSIRNDITANKIAEEQIRIATERYEIINNATRDTIWDKDFVHDKLSYNNGINSMFGYHLSEIENIDTWWEQNVHPDDIQRVLDLTADVTNKKQRFTVDEYRFRCADGSYKYIIDRISIFYDNEGKVSRMIGAMQDVTEAKENEKNILKAIIEAQERERTQLGMELHDNIKQILAATKLNLEMARLKINNKELVSDILSRSVSYISDSIQELRILSHQLAPTFDEAFQLQDSITNMIRNMDPQKLLKVSIHVDDIQQHLDNPIQTTIFRIVQEQFNNILKHAKATEVSIDIVLIETKVQLTIKDDGVGFDPALKKEGIGLENIRRRVQFLDGKFSLQTSPGNGCIVKVKIPLKQELA